MDRKPDRALAALRATRIADLSSDLRNQRLLLEGARAVRYCGPPRSGRLKRPANRRPCELTRLRSDILWAARRWVESRRAQIEMMYGDRYKDFAPLSDARTGQDILRAEIGYRAGRDALGHGTLSGKMPAKMAQTPDARAFQILCRPLCWERAATSSAQSPMLRLRLIRLKASCAI